MSNVKVGSAELIEAFLFDKTLILVGYGKNLTTGWKNWFEPIRMLDHYVFKQEAPSGPTGDVVLPFLAVNAFSSHVTKTVYVLKSSNGKETEIEVPVQSITVNSIEPVETLQEA